MSEHLSWIGIIIGLGAILFSYLIYRRVGKIEKTRRKQQKEHFEKLVKNNVEDALDIYNSVTIIAHRQLFTPEELDSKTRGLENLFKNKQEDIQRLIRDTKFYASMLSVIDTPSADMKEIIEKIEWLIKDFYILENSLDRNKRCWITLESQLRENKDFIESSMSSINTN